MVSKSRHLFYTMHSQHSIMYIQQKMNANWFILKLGLMGANAFWPSTFPFCPPVCSKNNKESGSDGGSSWSLLPLSPLTVDTSLSILYLHQPQKTLPTTRMRNSSFFSPSQKSGSLLLFLYISNMVDSISDYLILIFPENFQILSVWVTWHEHPVLPVQSSYQIWGGC